MKKFLFLFKNEKKLTFLIFNNIINPIRYSSNINIPVTLMLIKKAVTNEIKRIVLKSDFSSW